MTTPYPAQLKTTLAPATDTDPPTNPISTRDGIIGINPPVVIIKDMATPYDYDCVGDGLTDDTEAYQAWLTAIAGAAGYGAAGTFLISDNLVIKSGTTIYGSGRGTHIVKKASDFPAGKPMMQNAQFPSVVGAYSDSNIALYGVCFNGDDLVSTNSLLAFLGVDSLILRDCCLQHNRYQMVQIAGCSNVTVDACHFMDWGKVDHAEAAGTGTREGGAAIWMGPAANGDPSDVSIINSYFVDGRWSAIYVTGDRIDIIGNKFRHTVESCLFGGGHSISIIGNQFTDITRNDIENTAIELGGSNGVIDSNAFNEIGGAAVMLTDPLMWSIANNVINRPNRDATTPGATAAIAIRSFYGVDGPNGVTINNNTVSDPANLTGFAILFARFNAPTSSKMANVRCTSNIVPGPWGTAAVGFYPDRDTVVGAGNMVRDNCGGADQDWSRQIVNFIIASGSSGPVHIGGVGFKPSRIDFRAILPSASGNEAGSIGSIDFVSGFDIATQTTTTARTFMNTCNNWATNGSACFSSNQAGVACISIVASDGTDKCKASVTGIDDDGFTLTLDGTTTADVVVDAVCYC